MYTTDDIRDIAIQIERNGEKTYREAGEKAVDKQLAHLLNWLAEDEHRHANWFRALKTSGRKLSAMDQEMETMGRSLLREMVKDQPFCLDVEELDGAEDIEALVSQSLKFEQDTIIFYDMLKMLVEDEKALAQLDLIIDEERKHVRVLEKLRDKFVNGLDVDLAFTMP